MFSYFNQPNILQILAYTTLYIYFFKKVPPETCYVRLESKIKFIKCNFFFFYTISVSFVSQVLTLNGTNVHNDIIFIHLIWSHVISLNAFQGTRDEKRKRQKNFLEIWPSQNKQNNKIH